MWAFQSILPVQHTMAQCESHAPASLDNVPFREVLATAHSLAYVNSELVGDPVDSKLVQFSEWVRRPQP